MAEQQAPRRVVRATIEVEPRTETTAASPQAQSPQPEPVVQPEPKPQTAPKPRVEVQPEPEPEPQATEPQIPYDAPAASVEQGAPQAEAHTTSRKTSDSKRAAVSPGGVGRSVAGWVHRTFPGHEHAFWGGVIALLVALLVFAIGIGRVIFIGIVIFVGVAIGQVFDGDPKLVNAIRRLIGGERRPE